MHLKELKAEDRNAYTEMREPRTEIVKKMHFTLIRIEM